MPIAYGQYEESEWMAKQDRAARTREALLHSAATEFARGGYAGASMSRITKAAGLSTGALTFHFGSKSDLAGAVVERARASVAAVLDEVASSTGEDAPADRLGAVVIALVRKLYDDVEVQGAARLERDGPEDVSSWSADWYPVLRRLAGLACRAGDLPASTRPEHVAALAALFVRGADPHHRAHGTEADAGGESSTREFEQLWSLAERGIRSPAEP